MPGKKSVVKDTVNISEENTFVDSADQTPRENVVQTAEEKGVNTDKDYQEITIKFGKGFLGEPFNGKDGNEYRSVLIPNSDPDDRRPWATFVVRANQVHEDRFGKGMWTKVPAEGHTTIRRGHVVGRDEAGKDIWENVSTKVSNIELKSMVEFYKERPRESVKGKLAEKQAEVLAGKESRPKQEKKQAQEVAI